MPDRLATAAAWQRQPGTPTGRQAGARATALCQALGSVEAVQFAAELADDMVQKLPPGPLVGSRPTGSRSSPTWRPGSASG